MPGLIFDGLVAAARRTPDKAALLCGDQRLSYAELLARARGVAARIDALGARRVAITRANDPAVLELFLGSAMAGAVAMMFEPLWPPATAARMRAAHEPHLVFDVATVAEYARWRDAGDPARALRHAPTPDMPFLIGFTSGTTGMPKAFIRSHESWTASFAASAQELGTSAGTTALIPGPLSHGLSLYAAVETLNAGGCAAIMPRFDAPEAVRLAREGPVNTIVAAPTVLDLIVAATRDEALTSVTTLITAGAKLPPSLRARLAACCPHADVIEYYGASELSFVTVAKADEGCPPQSVGRAFKGVELAVRRDDCAPAAIGEVGTVWVRSAMLSAGYVGPSDGSGFRLRDGWATVGDLGSLDARGFLTLVGREGDMILTAGYNVYPSEVEVAVAAIPGVRAAAVLGLADERWGQVVCAVVELDAAVSALAAREHCARHLASYKVPRRWFMIDAFERTNSGKVDRARLLAMLQAGKLNPLP